MKVFDKKNKNLLKVAFFSLCALVFFFYSCILLIKADVAAVKIFIVQFLAWASLLLAFVYKIEHEKLDKIEKGETLGAHLRNLLSPYKTLINVIEDIKAENEIKHASAIDMVIKGCKENMDRLIEFSNCKEMEDNIYE